MFDMPITGSSTAARHYRRENNRKNVVREIQEEQVCKEDDARELELDEEVATNCYPEFYIE